ncbi:hypothetical protein [Nocardia goodfellowii]|uniref:Uncharacterized protein n=1 Tax=Nocardia goodfellowii TaxID=882446 RepID=A0ABS4Q9X3_9NOCA|nr:hypothetical protein [Nocardia goodfellowii]MBP2188490.1 hypothetical protein [Nocardia goodfellowii]
MSPNPEIGDHGLTPAGDRGHAAYVLGKLAEKVELSRIRAAVDWRTEVEKWGNRKELHDAFMYGWQQMQQRSPDQGWAHEYVIKTPLSERRLDAAQVRETKGVAVVVKSNEFKAGYVPREEGLHQLAKEEWLLANGIILESEAVIRDWADLDTEVAQRVQELAKKFPGRYRVVEAGPRDFERAVELGRPVVARQAMERLANAVERMRENPTLTVARDAISRFTAEVQQARERGEPISLSVLLGARDDLQRLVEADRQVIRDYDNLALKQANVPLRQSL